MKGRTARRRAILRYERWHSRRFPDALALRCSERDYARWARRKNKAIHAAVRTNTGTR